MKDFGLVSIITAAYNTDKFVARMIESIQAQTYSNWELLITDDCSTDNTRDIIKQYVAKDSRIKLFKLESNCGPGVARNNSIKKAAGHFIAFCDCDDSWKPEKLERQLKFMTNNGYALSYTSYDTCDEYDKINGYVKCPRKVTYKNIIRNDDIGFLTFIYDAGKIGKQYMPTIRRRQDWGFKINMIRTYGSAYGLEDSLSTYRLRSGSVSSKKLKLLRYNYAVYKDIVGYSPVVSALVLGFYFIPYYIYKKIKRKVYFVRLKKK